MQIINVSIIGLGALGVLFGHHLSKHMPAGNLRIIADEERIARYKQDGVFINDEPCNFNFVTGGEQITPADLILIAVKYNDLNDALKAIKNHVGENTIIISLLNGIISEKIIGEVYGGEKVLPCVAQGMDAVKVNNKLNFYNMGMICFGDWEAGTVTHKARAVAQFFDKTKLPYELVPDMKKRLWGKFMLNVGVNQTVAVYEGNYGTVQNSGEARETMIAAMREVVVLAEKEKVSLTEEDITYWLDILGKLSPFGKPSMRQDMEVKRLSEVALFSGTVIRLGKKHGLDFPVNKKMYDKIKETESQY
jgi:2-dehydropantoate 2-reductase